MFTFYYCCYLMYLLLKINFVFFFMSECCLLMRYRNTVIMWTIQIQKKVTQRRNFKGIQQTIKKTGKVIHRFLRQPKIQRFCSRQMKKRMNFSTINFHFSQIFVPMDAFQHVKNSGKSIKKYDNVDAVVNSNDKGL